MEWYVVVRKVLLKLIPHDDVMKWKYFPRYWSFVQGIHRWIPRTRTSDAEFDVFIDLRLNKRLSKQLWRWWYEMSSRSLWRHCNKFVIKNSLQKILIRYCTTTITSENAAMLFSAIAPAALFRESYVTVRGEHNGSWQTVLWHCLPLGSRGTCSTNPTRPINRYI